MKVRLYYNFVNLCGRFKHPVYCIKQKDNFDFRVSWNVPIDLLTELSSSRGWLNLKLLVIPVVLHEFALACLYIVVTCIHYWSVNGANVHSFHQFTHQICNLTKILVQLRLNKFQSYLYWLNFCLRFYHVLVKYSYKHKLIRPSYFQDVVF